MMGPRQVLHRSFTLVEVLVVFAIVAILIALLLPALDGVKESVNRVKCASNLHSLGAALLLYAHDNDGWFPDGPLPISGAVASTSLSWGLDGAAGDPWGARNSTWTRLSNLIQTTDVLYCPSATRKNFFNATWGSAIRSAPSQPWTNLCGSLIHYALVYHQANWMSARRVLAFETPNYTFIHGNFAYDTTGGPTEVYIKAGSGYVYDSDGNFLYSNGGATQFATSNHNYPGASTYRGNNVLFVDGRVEWQQGRMIGPLIFTEGWPPRDSPTPTHDWINYEY